MSRQMIQTKDIRFEGNSINKVTRSRVNEGPPILQRFHLQLLAVNAIWEIYGSKLRYTSIQGTTNQSLIIRMMLDG